MVTKTAGLTCTKSSWQDRQAWTMENGFVRLVILTGGGHIAEFAFGGSSGKPSLNPLWTPVWKTIEPYRYRPKLHASKYGPPAVGKTLSGITGHNICLDYFGAPSEEEAAEGMSIHGEAPCAKWTMVRRRVTARDASMTLSVRLPIAGLRFIREVTLRRAESVAYFKETVINERRADHFFHWTQHVTLGPPFLSHGEARVVISATKGLTWGHGYERNELLKASTGFRWPYAPGRSGKQVDLTEPFIQPGSGLVATVLLDPRRQLQFVGAMNTRHHLLIAYCFRRADFPWVAIWEENQARTQPPWMGRSQARGLEFGSTPLPVGRREAFASGSLFGAPTFCVVPARGRKTVSYIAFLAELPESFETLRDIRAGRGAVEILGPRKGEAVSIPSTGTW